MDYNKITNLFLNTKRKCKKQKEDIPRREKNTVNITQYSNCSIQ